VRVMRWSVGLAVGLTVLLLAACSGDDPGATSTINVDMEDNFYSRDVTRIGVGDTVNFRNRGVVPHNAIDVEGTWSTGLADGGDLLDLQDPGESVAITFEEEGVYTYYCSLHATSDGQEGMVATLVVGDVDYQAAADAPAEPLREWTGVTRQVPEEYPTIQNAVDAAEPGDLVLISPAPESSEYLADDGAYVYKEQVDVTTPYITIRGTDRNAVIIDGEHERTMAINVQAANGVAVENLTARNATGNGIYWTSLEGFRGSYLTAYNNGIYGIYSYDASDGLFEHSYASGSQDAGFYIGQCDPCDSIITNVIAERNALGYSGTNSSHVYLVDSVWRHNIAGIVPNTLDSQRLPPFGNVTIVGNLIHDNDSREAPVFGSYWPAFGNGVVLAGGMDSLVERNRIVNHERGGVAVIPNLSRNFWMSGGNVVRDNVITGSGYGDLTLHGPALGGNCFAGNDHRHSVPAGLESVASCGPDAVAGAHADADPDRGGFRLPSRSELAATWSLIGLAAEAEFGMMPDVDYRQMPAPPEQPQMPDGPDAQVVPAVDVFASYGFDLADYAVPDLPADVEVGRTTVVSVGNVPFGIGLPSTYFGIVGWLMPFSLFVAWVALTMIDVARREDLTPAGKAGWTVGALLVPFAGAAAYLLAGRPTFPAWQRWLMVVGAVVVIVVVTLVSVIVGGLL
jgi:plastocyanin